MNRLRNDAKVSLCYEYLTTDYGSIIDHMYTSIPLFDIISWGTLETYYSDHKPFFVSLK